MTYDGHTRQRVLELVWLLGNASIPDIARMYRISERTIYDWRKEFEEDGVVAPARERRPKAWSTLDPEHVDFALLMWELNPIAYPREVADEIFERCIIFLLISSDCRA